MIRRLLSLLRRRRLDRELDAELGHHIESLETEYIARGLSPGEARLAARRDFGGIARTREAYREQRGVPFLDTMVKDLRFAARMLRRAPGFTAIAVLTLALGIGATTAIFSVINTVLLRPLPYRNPERLVRIIENIPAGESFTGAAVRMPAMNQAEFDWWRTNLTRLSELAVIAPQPYTLRTADGNVRLAGASVSPALFSMRGIVPIAGRGLHPDDEQPGVDVVVLGAGTWARYFGSDPQVVNRPIVLDNRPWTVAGVMPREFGDEEFWVPYVVGPSREGNVTFLNVVGRLADGVTLEAATVEVETLGHQLRSTPSEPETPPRFELARIQDATVAPFRPALRVLAGAVGVVLLIACANVANLLLARGRRREQEVGIRRSLGAARARILRQMLTESLLLALLGGAAGVGLAYGGVGLLKMLSTVELPAGFPQALDTALLPRIDAIAVDSTVLLFALGLAAATGILFGLGPAVRLSALDSTGAGWRRTRFRSPGSRVNHALATAQLGLATTLLVGAALLLHSFVKLASVDPGFDPENTLTFDLVLPMDYLAERKLAIAEEVAARLGASPRIAAAGFSDGPPLSNRTARPYGAYTPPVQEGDDSGLEIDQRLVSTDYLRALGARLVAGRWFEEGDGSARPAPIMVNRAYARYYFGDRDPVGAVLQTRSGPAVVVGVVGDIRFQGVDSPPGLVGFADPRHALALNNQLLAERGRERSAEGNRLFLTGFTGGLAYAVRAGGDPLAVVSDIRRIASEVDPAAAVDSVMPLGRVVAGTIAEPRFYAVLVGVFGVLAAAVAAVGVYGVLAYVVSQRTHEFGIRMALGADRKDVLELVFRRGAAMVLIGIPGGIAGAAALTRSLESLLYGLTPLDPLTYAITGVGFAGVALLASYVPAWHATMVDPLSAIRYE